MASSGNIAVFNPLSKVGTITFSEGNTIAKHVNNKENTRHGTTFNIPNTGKWYFECKFVNCNTNGSQSVMFTLHDVATEPVFSSKNFLTQSGNFISFYNWQNRIYISNSYTAYTSNIATQSNAIVSCAIDRDNSHMWVAVNNTWINGTPDFTDGTNKVASPSASLEYGLAWSGDGGGSSQFWTANFGQDSTFAGTETAQGNQDSNGFGDFYYAPPTDFLAISSANLPISADIDPAQTDDDFPQKQFNVVTYTGDGNNNRSVSGVGFKPDLIWGKIRSSADSHFLYDSNRGSNVLRSDQTSAESDYSSYWSQFDSDGWTFGNQASSQNLSSGTFVTWCWRANGGTTASNSDGATASVTQANTKSGFSIITYTGFAGASGTSTVGHSLQKAPEFIITKSRNSDSGWWVQHVGLSAVTKTILLNSNSAEGDYSGYGSLSAPTSSVFSINGVEGIGGSSKNYIAYCWHSVEGYSKFGVYTASGSDNDNAPFIYTGFRPRLLAIKGVDTTNSWMVFDTARSTSNPVIKNLHWDSSEAEATEDYRDLDILSNGFKIRTNNGALNHPSGDKYIFCAWGDLSFKYQSNTF